MNKTYPLLQSQMGVFLECLANPDMTKYNLPSVTTFSKKIDIERLASALALMTEVHVEMKTRFIMDDDGAPRQYSDPEMHIPIVRHQFTEEQAREYMDRRFVRSFDVLSGEPLWRIELINTPEHIYLLLDVHHLIGDGMSLASIFSNVLVPEAYEKASLERPAYGMYEYAEDEQAKLATEVYERAKQYYAEKFSTAEFVDLSNNTTAPWGDTIRESAYLDQASVDGWCREQGTAANLLFMAAFSYVVSRVSRNEEIAFYTINHGRLDKRLMQSMGMFVRSTPILAKVNPQQSVLDFVRGFRTELVSTIRYGVYPFSHFCRDLHVTPSISFSFQGEAIQEYIPLEGEKAPSVQLPKGKSNADLSCIIYLTEGKYDIRLEASNALYSQRQLAVYAQAISCAMLNMMQAPEASLSSVELTSAESREAVLRLGQGIPISSEEGDTVVRRFRRQAALNPDALCLVFQNRSYTYREMDELTDRLAVKLNHIGVREESHVGVMVSRSELMVVYPLAIMKAGGAYMPLDSHFPEERLNFMCQDAEVRVILADDNVVRQAMPTFTGIVLESSELDGLPTVTAQEVDDLGTLKPTNGFVVLYTSGSTGKPKGVILEQSNLTNFCTWFTQYFKVTAQDRMAAFANFGFDVHQADLWPMLTVGGSVYIIPEEMRLNLHELEQYINQNQLTLANITTQIGAMFATSVPNSSLRALIVAGEKLGPTVKPKYGFFNAYGPTECSIYATCFDIVEDYQSMKIGRPLYNYDLAVVDAHLNPMPEGLPGELLICGAGVGRGYLNRPDLTAEKFITYEGKRAYRTGDLVRWAEDGNLEYLGRMDNQVKLRGLRIELGEIENRVALMEGVKQVCVDVKEVGGLQNLVCYYCVKEGCAVKDADLKSWIAETLTAFMVPEIYVQLDQLPLTPNGKVNRRALPIPEITGNIGEIIAPETPLEKQLFDVTAEMLQTDQFGVTTNLISVGLTSLSAMRLSALIQKRLQKTILTKDILATPYLRELAANASDKEETKTVRKKRDYYPLSENQRGVYIDWEMNREALQYNMPKVYKLKDVNASDLQAALVQVINAHPCMKTRFAQIDGDVVQLRKDDEEPVVVVAHLDYEPDKAFFQQKVRPFDLFNDQLYRFEIYEAPNSTYLFQDTHHSVFDGISGMVLLMDLEKVLHGNSIVPEKYTAFDLALDEQELLAGKEGKTAETYFDNLLQNMESTAYPHSREDVSEAGFGTYRMTMPADDIDQFCKRTGTTANAYFATILTQLLHRVTREESVLISTIDNGRTESALMQSTGMFVKTLPIVSLLDEKSANSTSIADAVQTMYRQLVSTLNYSYYPFTRMSERHHIRPEILYVYHGSLADEAAEIQGGEEILLDLDTVKMPLTVTVYHEGSAGYRLMLSYNPAFYSALDMAILANGFSAAALNALDGKTLSDFSMLDENSRAQIEKFRSSAKEEVPYKLFYQPIEANAEKYAEKTALIAKDRTLTFSEFNREANRVAHALIRRGIKKGDRVVLLLPRTSAVLVSMFGVSKAGAAYIPCDPEYPADRINLIMTDSEAQYVITTPAHAADYPAEKVILIDDLYNTSSVQSGDDENPNVDVHPEDLAYLIYTSGSTGRPKGVMLRHIGIANYLYDHPANIHIHGLMELNVQSFVTITTLSFDMSLKEFAGALFNGITCVLADEQEVMDAKLLADLMKRTGAEAINGTCSRLLTYLELDDFKEALSHCKAVWSGGEQYPMQLLTQLQDLGVHVFNTYGPTEITVSSNIADLTKSAKVNVGRPLLNYEEFIVDIFDNELPVGIVGEILIGGPGVAVGYNNLPEMTAERFVEHRGVRVYRSGDLARWLPDGAVEIIGRNDGQVKLRGFRVELGEIEGVAAKYAGVRQAVADVKNIGPMQHLCLYYTSNEELDEEAMKKFLAESLTEYMVPTCYVRIDAIPLTPNGKTNKKALPVPQIKLEEVVAPSTPMEELLLDFIKAQLKIEEVGVTTNLVSVGLSSIAAMRLSAALLQQKQLQLPVKQILEHPTVRELATLTSEDGGTTQFKAYEKRKYYPLSESQRGMLIDCLMNPDALLYNIPALFHYKNLDIERLKQALNAVGDAHPYLKARISQQDGDYVQVRNDEQPLDFEEIRLDFDPERSYFQSQIRPFDILNDNLCRIKIYTTPTSNYLLFDVHHLISDGSSNYILAREMEKAYRGEKLTKEEYTAYDRALDEQALMQTERAAKAEAYFDNLLSGQEATVYPHSTNVEHPANYGILRRTMASDGIRAFCQKNGIAPSSYFLTVLHHVLHRLTREESTLIYFISNGRTEVQLENFFGVFVKTMPTVVTDYSSSMLASAKSMHQQMMDTISNDFYPFTKMVERHGIKAEIIYNYFVDLQTSVSLGTDAIEGGALDWNMAKTPLMISMFKTDAGEFECSIEYDAQLYNESDILTLNEAFCNFAVYAAAHAEESLKRVPLISDIQQRDLLQLGAGPRVQVDLSQTFAQLFTEQARRTPDALAVADDCSEYTYRELDERSDTFAHILVERGILPNMFVCIMQERTKDYPLTVLAIHKAGAAYTPLDLEYPNERLSYMVGNSEAKIVITTHAVLDMKRNEGGLEFGDVTFIFMDELDLSMHTDPIRLTTPENLAYMIYTSGSTGLPKGVMLHQKGLRNYIASIIDVMGITAADRISNHRPFSFDAHIQDLYPALTVGGSIHIMPTAIRKEMPALRDFIVNHGITGGSYTTSLGAMLLDFYKLPLRYMTLTGEKMIGLVSGDVQLINGYGPTECTDLVSAYRLEQGRNYKDIPIGRPMANSYCLIVDAHGNLMPRGIPGELCFASVQVGRGYWKLPEKTDEVFLNLPEYLCPDPALDITKMYRTGDLCRWNEEGQIEYMGRIDSQVKLRGFRVELGEIETQAKKVEGVRQAVALVREVVGMQHLVLYYTVKEDMTVTDKDLNDFLVSTKLAEYMIPEIYMQMDEFPYTGSGKINRKALPVPEIKTEEIVAPETELEKQLFEIASETLQHAQFGVTTNLITVGMNSLSAMRMGSVVNAKLNVTIHLQDFMQEPTIKHLTDLVEKARKSEQEDNAFSNLSMNPHKSDPAKKKVNLFAKKK